MVYISCMLKFSVAQKAIWKARRSYHCLVLPFDWVSMIFDVQEGNLCMLGWPSQAVLGGHHSYHIGTTLPVKQTLALLSYFFLAKHFLSSWFFLFRPWGGQVQGQTPAQCRTLLSFNPQPLPPFLTCLQTTSLCLNPMSSHIQWGCPKTRICFYFSW